MEFVYGAKIVVGAPDGWHTEMDSTSFRLYRPDGSVWVELPNGTGDALLGLGVGEERKKR